MASERKLNEALVGENPEWVSRKLFLTHEEWDFLGVLALKWFGKNKRKKWAVARMCDEIRVLFTAPPSDQCKGHVLDIREKDMEMLHLLRKAFGLRQLSGAIRSLLYMMDEAPEPMFVHLHNDIANYPNRFDGLWAWKLLQRLKGTKELPRVRTHFYSRRQLDRPIGKCQVRRLLAQASIDREKD